ncbi:MaoC family dehydratase [Tissierella sp. Yu-01]|uniref:MaoC family dehydratase n=1 Tax=Tissierella sp. Yu-01 TaxID=3035694 RepID=UPI00240E942B|nr:MaoC family dehydratase [Tissierella sp. Yu-01]WFA10038.1 MaoC family dehydratase [Tissierella sp. Yu-01]
MIKQIAYDDIQIGDYAEMRKTILAKDVDAFASIVNDTESFHISDEVAQQFSFKKRICHGIHIASYISELVGKELPGFGTIYISQTLDFKKPVYLDSTIRIYVKVIEKLPNRRLSMLTIITDDIEDIVLVGEAVVKTFK